MCKCNDPYRSKIPEETVKTSTKETLDERNERLAKYKKIKEAAATMLIFLVPSLLSITIGILWPHLSSSVGFTAVMSAIFLTIGVFIATMNYMEWGG